MIIGPKRSVSRHPPCVYNYLIVSFVVDVANSIDPPIYNMVPKGKPGSARDKALSVTFNTSKFKRVIGHEYIPLKQTIKDSLEDFKSRGWLPSGIEN